VVGARGEPEAHHGLFQQGALGVRQGAVAFHVTRAELGVGAALSCELPLACGKYRFNKMELGDIGGIPRLLDIGQCNDAYSAVKIASALAEAFGCGVNDLPLSLILSWYEQKAVAILLSLLHLGIKGIRLGPTLPAFISPNVLNILVENFDIRPIKTASEDLEEILG